jgi:type VI secretion system secreted protein VgrG
MHAREELSRPSEFQINLLSERSDITVDDILGKNVTVKLEAPGDGTRNLARNEPARLSPL